MELHEIKRILNKITFKIQVSLKQVASLFSINSEKIFGKDDNDVFSPKLHSHNFLKKNTYAESTLKLGDYQCSDFSPRHHNHSQYVSNTENIKQDQKTIGNYTSKNLSLYNHNHDKYVLKSKLLFNNASKLYDYSNNVFLSAVSSFAANIHSHFDYVPYGSKTKFANGLIATKYNINNEILEPSQQILTQQSISKKNHDHNNIYLTKSQVTEVFMPKDFKISESTGYQDSQSKYKIRIYRYIPNHSKKETATVETFDTNLLTSKEFETQFLGVNEGDVFGYMNLNEFHGAWRRNYFENTQMNWASFPGDLNKRIGLDITDMFSQKSIPGNDNTNTLLSGLRNKSGTLDGVNLNDIYGTNGSTQFIILFANNATQKKLNEVGPKPIIEFTPDVQTVNVDIFHSMKQAFDNAGTSQGSIETKGPNSFLYGATSRTMIHEEPVSTFKTKTKSWLDSKETSAGFRLSAPQCSRHRSAFYNIIDSWYNSSSNFPGGKDKVQLKGLNRNEYYWYYNVPAKPDLGESANIFETITEVVGMAIQNFATKLYEIFTILLLVVDYFLCFGLNFILSLVDDLLRTFLDAITFFQIYWAVNILNLATFEINIMPAKFLFSLYDMFLFRKPYVPIAKFASSNPVGGNMILLSKEVSTRFSTEWKRIIGYTPIIRTPYQMLNSIKIGKPHQSKSYTFINPSSNYFFSKDYVQVLNSWRIQTGTPRFKEPHLLKNGRLSYELIPIHTDLDWKYLNFSVQDSGTEFQVFNYGMPFTLVSFEEDI